VNVIGLLSNSVQVGAESSSSYIWAKTDPHSSRMVSLLQLSFLLAPMKGMNTADEHGCTGHKRVCYVTFLLVTLQLSL